MRLVRVAETDFRKSEATMFTELMKASPHKMSATDVVLFVSKQGNQLVFVWAPVEVSDDEEGASHRRVLASRRLRIQGGGRWNPLMLRNYAEHAGVDLQGLARFEEHLKRAKREKEQG